MFVSFCHVFLLEYKSDEYQDCFEKANTMKAIQAIFRDGAFWPVEPVQLPEASRVELEPRLIEEERPLKAPSLEDVYEVLNRRSQTGETNVAERHNEHQP